MYKFSEDLLSLPFPEIVDELSGYVCYRYGITKEDLKSDNREDHLAQARKVLYHICKMFDVPSIYILRIMHRDRTLAYNYDIWVNKEPNRRIIRYYIKFIEFTLEQQKKTFNIT